MKALTVRLPEPLYTQSRELAKKRHISVNALIQQSLEAFARAEEERALYHAFSIVGEDAHVEYAVDAQREVLCDDE